MARFIIINDARGLLPSLRPPYDGVLVAGDIYPSGYSAEVQHEWSERVLRPWLERTQRDGRGPILYTPGNGDYRAESPQGLRAIRGLPWRTLDRETALLRGYAVYGAAKVDAASIPPEARVVLSSTPVEGLADAPSPVGRVLVSGRPAQTPAGWLLAGEGVWVLELTQTHLTLTRESLA